jgi:cell division inhibitor SepF
MARSFLKNLLWGPVDDEYEMDGRYDDVPPMPPAYEPEPTEDETTTPRPPRRGRTFGRSDDVVELRAPSRPLTEIHYPRSFDDAQGLADLYKQGALLIVDLEQVDEKDRARLVHFLCGVAYGRDGRSERVNDLTFVFAPRHFELETEGRGREPMDGDYPLPRYRVPGLG